MGQHQRPGSGDDEEGGSFFIIVIIVRWVREHQASHQLTLLLRMGVLDLFSTCGWTSHFAPYWIGLSGRCCCCTLLQEGQVRSGVVAVASLISRDLALQRPKVET